MGKPLPTFYDFIGQRAIIKYIDKVLKGAIHQGEMFPHTLFCGSPGLGKTELARAIARGYGTTLHEVTDPRGFGRVQLARLAEQFKPNDFLFIDEAHRLRSPDQERLYRVICERLAPQITVGATSGKFEILGDMEIPPVTVLAATDQPGDLLKAFKSRFDDVQFELYSLKEMKSIVEVRASQASITLTPQAANCLGQASRGVPRRAGQLLQWLVLYTAGDVANGSPSGVVTSSDGEGSHASKHFDKDQVRKFCKARGIDKHGLTRLDRRYLQALAGNAGAALSLNNLTHQLGTHASTLSVDVEPFLVREGLVTIGPGGRMITEAGQNMLHADDNADTGADVDRDSQSHITPVPAQLALAE